MLARKARTVAEASRLTDSARPSALPITNATSRASIAPARELVGQHARRPRLARARRARRRARSCRRPRSAPPRRRGSARRSCRDRAARASARRARAETPAACGARIRPSPRRPTPASADRARRRGASSRNCEARGRARTPPRRSGGGAVGSLGAALRRGRSPELLQVVVRAHRRLHDVDDDVARRRPAPTRRSPRLRRRRSSRRSRFSLSRTWRASAFTCRWDSAVAMIMVSNRLVSLRTSRTVTSRALMSSSAETAVFWILLSRILDGRGRVGCVQYRPKPRREAIRARRRCRRRRATEAFAYRRRGDRMRGDLLAG